MKIYQLIYTSVKHSLSDSSLGLVNQPGYRVYSCSQGLTQGDIFEVIRFCGYRLPKNIDISYSETPFDTSIPDKFPKTFRTLKLASGCRNPSFVFRLRLGRRKRQFLCACVYY